MGDTVKNLLSFKHLSAFCAIFTATALISFGTASAQNTASSIRVDVINADGTAAGGVAVSITHVPTGRSQILTSNNDGVVTARGLAVGGPYEVRAASDSHAADVIQGIYIELDQTELVELIVRSSIEEVIVTAEAITEEVVVGVGTAFDRAAIEATPSISRDFVSTLARDPKILVDNSVARGPAVSMAGQNFRFNSVTIDGVPQNDNFGLSKNASATQRTPISIDAIQAINVNLAPFDVTYGNFIGGNINIVTKSGTNDLTGSAYYFSTDDSLSGDRSKNDRIDIGDFSESIASLLRADLLKSSEDPRGEVFYSEESARRVLDIYRNSIVHYLAAPSFLARRLLAGPAPVDLRAELAEWLDLFYSEYYIPRGEILAAHFDAFVDHFERIGCVELGNGRLCVTEKGASRFAFLAEQTRGVVEVYSATIAAVAAVEGDMTYKGLINAATEQFQRSELLGEALCPESLNETTIENALALLVKRGILERSSEKVAKKGDIAYLRGADFGDLVALRERLASALSAR